MKYKPEWKGHLRVGEWGDVFWDEKPLGKITRKRKVGARSPRGMKTDAVFVTDKTGTEFQSMTLAIESLIPMRKK